MRNGIRDAPEYTSDSLHSLVPDNNEVCLHPFCGLNDRVDWVTGGCVNYRLEPLLLNDSRQSIEEDVGRVNGARLAELRREVLHTNRFRIVGRHNMKHSTRQSRDTGSSHHGLEGRQRVIGPDDHIVEHVSLPLEARSFDFP